MVKIIGSRTEYEHGSGRKVQVKKAVATFSTVKEALEYIGKSRYPNFSCDDELTLPFMKESVLSRYETASILDVPVRESPPHNPVL